MNSFRSYTMFFAAAGWAFAQMGTGMAVKEFAMPEGKVRVHLPDSAGRFSGRVVAEPAQPGMLEGYVVEMGGARASVKGGVLSGVMAAAGAVLTLRDASGKAVQSVPFQPGEWVSEGMVPRIVQSGRPVALPGSFDADFATTNARVNGNPMEVLLETQDRAVVSIPVETRGPAVISMNEGGVERSYPVHAASVAMSAPKTNLRRGEKTVVSVRVEGLQGIESPATLVLRNHSPQHVRLDGGEAESIAIGPSEVNAQGVWEATRTVTGVAPGAFTLTGDVVPPMLCAADDCAELRKKRDEIAEDLEAKENEIKKKVNEANAQDDLAKKAKNGSPSDWEKQAKKHEKAAAGKKEGSEAQKKEQELAEKARTTAQELKSAGVPEDNPKTPSNETLDTAEAMEEKAKRLREDVDNLKTEADILKKELKKADDALKECLKKQKKAK